MHREPTVADLVAARRVVDRYLPRAPLERSPLLSADLDAEIYLKIETFKPTRTFKVRGALNKIASLDDAARRRGVVAASAGSHAQGVAFAASALGAPATVIMPRGVSETIVRVCRAYGAQVLLEGDVYDDTLALAHRIEREQGKTLIHPYADPLVIAGQGTIGLEILDDLPDVELVIVAVGGGGLIAGIALALRSSRPTIRIVGVEPEGADAVNRATSISADPSARNRARSRLPQLPSFLALRLMVGSPLPSTMAVELPAMASGSCVWQPAAAASGSVRPTRTA